MHEVGIIRDAVRIAIEAARDVGADRIVRIKLRVGAMAGVVPEALRFGFDVVTQGTEAEGAILEIEQVPVTCSCESGCGVFEPSDFVFECPTCGRLATKVETGRELDVAEVEV